MKPIHAVAIAAALAVAAVLGVAAATKTSTLGASAGHASAASIATRAHKLDSFEAVLKKALRSKPPALPKVPTAGAGDVAAPAVGSTPMASASAPRVIYRRPAPIIIHKRSHRGDDGYESEGGGSGGDD